MEASRKSQFSPLQRSHTTPSLFPNILKCQLHCKRHSWLIQPYSTAALILFFLMNDWCFPVCLSENFLLSVIPVSCSLSDSLALHPKGHCYWSVNHRKTFLPGCPLQKRQRTIGKQLKYLFTRGTLTVGRVPWGGLRNKRCRNHRKWAWLCLPK